MNNTYDFNPFEHTPSLNHHIASNMQNNSKDIVLAGNAKLVVYGLVFIVIVYAGLCIYDWVKNRNDEIKRKI